MSDEIKITYKDIMKYISILILIMILWGSWFMVGAGKSAVVFNKLSGIKETTYGEGFHFKYPVFDKVTKFDVRTVKYEAEASSASKDLQTVHAKVALNYHIDKNAVYSLYQNIGTDYESRIINPSIQEVVKAVTAKHIAEELITKRETLKEEIKQLLSERLARSYLTLDDFSITNFDFSPEFNQAIEQKVTAEQNALKEQNNLRVVQFQAEQRIAEAKGQAEAIKVINQELSSNPNYIQYLTVQKWNGVLPQVTGANSFIQLPLNNMS